MEPVKHMADATSALAVLVSFLNLFPALLSMLSAVLAIVWYWIRISEYLSNKKIMSSQKLGEEMDK